MPNSKFCSSLRIICSLESTLSCGYGRFITCFQVVNVRILARASIFIIVSNSLKTRSNENKWSRNVLVGFDGFETLFQHAYSWLFRIPLKSEIQDRANGHSWSRNVLDGFDGCETLFEITSNSSSGHNLSRMVPI